MKKRLILFLGLAVILLLIFLPSYSKYQRLLTEQRRLESQIEELEMLNEQLEERKQNLENDIEYIESRAREKLGVVRKDEIPYKIMEEGGEDEE